MNKKLQKKPARKKKQQKKPAGKDQAEEEPAASKGPPKVPLEEQLHELIRSERWTARLEHAQELEALQAHLNRGPEPLYVPARVLENAFYLPLDEDQREWLGHPPYGSRADTLFVNPFPKPKKGKKAR